MAKPSKEEVESVLTKYAIAYKAGDVKALKENREAMHKMVGFSSPKTDKPKEGAK